MFAIGGVQLWFGIDGDNWHHVAGSYVGSEMKVYVDGKFVSSANATMTLDASIPITIGQRQSSPQRYFNGRIDEVRIWDDVRTEAEIRENMCKTLTGNEANLVAYYSCDNTTGTILQDFSGNANNGTLTNMDDSDWVTSDAFNTWLNTSSSTWSEA